MNQCKLTPKDFGRRAPFSDARQVMVQKETQTLEAEGTERIVGFQCKSLRIMQMIAKIKNGIERKAIYYGEQGYRP